MKKKLLIMGCCLLWIAASVTAQTTTKFNDGYLTVFRQSAVPIGSLTTLSGTATSGNATITGITSTTGVLAGMHVSISGAYTAASIGIAAVTSTTITLGANAAASGVVTITFNNTLGNFHTAINLDEYNTTTASQASPNYTAPLPISETGIGILGFGSVAVNNNAGFISKSENGRYIVVPGYGANLTTVRPGGTNATNCAIRLVNGSGPMATTNGVSTTTNWFTSGGDYRGATSDDGTNFWVGGGSIGVRTTTSANSLTTVSTSNTATRVIQIFNGQLYYSSPNITGGGFVGISQVGTGKPVVTGAGISTLTANPGAPHGFSISPDGKTIYSVSATSTISRYTYSGTFNGTHSGGTWTAAAITTVAIPNAYGLTVDWSGYSFQTGATPNGAVIYASSLTNIYRAPDNGTGSLTLTTLATVNGTSTAFRHIAFSPVKQTISKGSNSPSGTVSGSDKALFQFNLSADEGNSSIKSVVVHQAGTASLSTDLSSFRLIDDANSNGIYDGGETLLSTGTVSGSDITFASITLSEYINEGSNKNFLVIGNVSATSAYGVTFIPSIESNKTLNSVNYTTNLRNVGSSWVNIGASAPTGNTITINQNRWLGASGTSWSSTTNWSNGALPLTSDDVVIPSGTTDIPTLSGLTTTIKSLTIASGASLTIAPDAAISISGTTTNNGTLTLKSDATGTGSIGNSGTITGNVIVERYIASSGRRRYVLVTSPVTSTINAGWQEGTTGATFTTTSGFGTSITGGVAQGTNGFDGPASSASGIFTYNDDQVSGSKWRVLANTIDAASLAPGKGYLLFVRGDRSSNFATTPALSSSTTLRATGAIGQGSVSPGLLTGVSKYTLIANPYPCVIDWNSGSLTKTNLTGSFTVYDPNNNVFVSSNGTTKTPSIGNQQAGFIQSGQAFFVQNDGTGNGAITFSEAAKTTSATTTSSTTVFGEDAKKMQLNINVFRTADNSFADGVVVLFGNNYKTAVDSKEDIYKFTNLNETFGLRRNNTVLGLEARPKVQSTDTTYFSLKSFTKKSYKLVLDGNNFEETTSATLEDKFTGASTAIDVNGITTYNFTISDDAASSSNDRFIITFGSTAASTVVIDGTAASSLFVKMSPNPVRNQLRISFKTATAEATSINVVNSLGQVVKTVNAGNVATGNVSVAVAELATGVYTVQLISDGKVVSTQQVVKAEN